MTSLTTVLSSAAYSTAIFLLKTLPIVVIALYLVSYSIRKGYMEKLSTLFHPLLARLGLSEIAVVSVTTSFLSPTASYSILAQAWREGEVDERGIIAISFLNSFPSVFSHMYAFFLPFAIPVLGFVGVIYMALRLAVAAIKSLIGYILILRWRERFDTGKVEVKPFSPGENLLRVCVIMGVTYLTVSVISEYSIFNAFGEITNFIPLHPGSIAIAAVEFFNIRAAIVLGAGFLDKGLCWKWVVIGLLLGNVISFSTRSVKHSLPLHLSLFGKFGVKIVLLNSFATLLLDIAAIALLLIA